jgi:hypothetical protein
MKKIFFARHGRARETVVQQIQTGAVKERRRKMVQFRAVFFLLQQGRPMSDFCDIHELFEILCVLELPKKHWSVGLSWEMADDISMT